MVNWHQIAPHTPTALESISQIVTIVGAIVTIAGGGFAIYWAIKTWRESNAQRRAELTWKRAKQGKQLWDEIIENQKCVDALQMIEPSARDYSIDGTKQTLTHERAMAALNPGPSTGSISFFVCDAFDELLYHFDRLGHHLRVGLVRFEDIESPTEYYVTWMIPDKEIYVIYLHALHYRRVFDLLNRFPAWRGDPVNGRPTQA